MVETHPHVSKSPAFRAILLAGLACGILDILSVVVFYGLRGANPIRILQSPAAGLLGRGAFDGGLATAALGQLCHFTISFAAAGVFYLASRRIAFLTRHALPSGVAYGGAVWLFMQLVVLPLTPAAPSSFPPQNFLPILAAHLLFVGPPIALVVARLAPLAPATYRPLSDPA